MERIWFWSNFDLVALQILRYIQRSSVGDMKDKVSYLKIRRAEKQKLYTYFMEAATSEERKKYKEGFRTNQCR